LDIFKHLPLNPPVVLAVCGLGGGSERAAPTVNLRRFDSTQGAILVFSYEERASFDALTDWLCSLYSVADGSRVLFLVATHQSPTKDQAVFKRRLQLFCDSALVDEFFEMVRPDSAQVARIFARIRERLVQRERQSASF
jgi:hypothetical protein